MTSIYWCNIELIMLSKLIFSTNFFYKTHEKLTTNFLLLKHLYQLLDTNQRY